MARAKIEKFPPRPVAGSHNTSDKSFQSERISSHIDAFEKSGGHVEKLGVTPYVHKRAPSKHIKPIPAVPGKPGTS